MATDSSSYYRSRINHYLDQAEQTRATMPYNRALAVMCLKLAKVALDLYLRRMDEEDAERAQTALDEAEKTRRLQAYLNSLDPFRRAFRRAKLQGRH